MENGTNSEMRSQVPKVDFSGLDLNSDAPAGSGSHSSRWEAVRAQLMDAIETYGFFEAVLDDAKLPPGLIKEVFNKTLGELFSVPIENKLQHTGSNPYYESYISYPTFEIFCIESVESFAALMWPLQGNPSFSNKICSISKALGQLDRMVLRMILEGLGVDRHYESLLKSTKQVIRLANYYPHKEGQDTTMIKMRPHTDMNVISIVYQHEEQGLEILAPDGRWMQAPRNSFTVLTGDTLMAMTNGKLKPNLHRVKRTRNDTERYSIGFSSHFRAGFMIDVFDELVDKEHPKLFKPYDYLSYMNFLMTESGQSPSAGNNALQVYCGVQSEDIAP